jgi:hypothetical protein
MSNLMEQQLEPINWVSGSDNCIMAQQHGAVVGKIWPGMERKGSFYFNCSAWGGAWRQSAKGYAPSLEDAKRYITFVVTNGSRSE